MVKTAPLAAPAPSLDGELLDCIQEALADPAERKFIIVHLLGAHPHYRLRFPKGENPSTMKWTASRRKWSPSSDRPWCAAIGKSTTRRCCTTTSWWRNPCA